MPCMRCQPRTSVEAVLRVVLVVDAGRRIDQMDRRDVAFAAPRRRDAAHAADRDGARRDALRRTARRAPRRARRNGCRRSRGRARAPARSASRAARVPASTARAQRVDFEEAVGLREGRDRAGALADRKRDPARRSPATSATSTNSLRPSSEGMRTGTVASTVTAASGGRPALARITGATKAWNVKIAEVGKPGSTTIGLPSATARQSGLPGLSATPCTTTPGAPSRETMRCERSPAPFEVPPESTTMSQSASASRTAASSAASSSGNAPKRDRLAAGLAHRRGDDRAVASRRPRPAAAAAPGATSSSPVESTATFGRRTTSTCGEAAGRQHADLARGDRARRAAAASRRARCRSPHRRRTGPARPRGAGRSRARAASISSVCSIITTASAPRGTTPPVAIAVAVPGATVSCRRVAAGEHLGVEREPARRGFGRADRVGGAQREAVDIGAVERRHVDRRRDVVREHAAERVGERHALGAERRQIEMPSRSAPSPPRPRRLRGTAPAARPRAPRRAAPFPGCVRASFMGTPASRAARRPESLRSPAAPAPSRRRASIACSGQ